jgi:hypothetical protein
VVARATLDDLRDKLYVLECAIEDVQRDLAASSDALALREALDWILEAAEPLLVTDGGGTAGRS